MKCTVLENGKTEMRDSAPLTAIEGHCVFEVKAAGICGSDIPRVFGGASYYYPIVLGHEFSGVVKDSKNPSLIGKRACVFPILPCMECEFCQKQQWANCKSYDYYGSRRDGGMQSELLIKESNLVFLPNNVSFEAGAMVEPLAVCLHAVKKADICANSSVLIYGAGTIGLLSGMWARALGASAVYFSDPDTKRCNMARELGFEIYGGESINTVIEASGASIALCDAIERCEPFGKMVLVGHGKKDVTLNHSLFVKILRKQLTLVGSWNSDRNDTNDDWADSVLAISEGKISPEALITHKIPLCNAPDAFQIIGDGKEFYNKIMVVM